MNNQYVGNNDFRGYLSYLGQGGDNNANALLNYVGNDYTLGGGTGVNRSKLDNDVKYAPNQVFTYGNTDNAVRGIDDYYRKWTGGASLGSPTGGVSAAPDTTQADLAYLDDQEGQLRGLLGSAQNTLNNGLTQIGDSYNKETGRTAQQRASAAAGFNTKREDTTRGKLGAINQVNTGARTLSDSVRRLLGQASGANSSAYQIAAPGAIARDASMKRTDTNETYGRNFRDLDTAEKDTNSKFDQYLQDLAEQKKQKESGLREGVLQQEQGIYGNLSDVARQRALLQGGGYSQVRQAMAPASAAISQRQSALDQLFNQFRTPYNTQDVQVANPQLADYTVDKTALNLGQNGGDQYSPYSNFLKKKFQPQTA